MSKAHIFAVTLLVVVLDTWLANDYEQLFSGLDPWDAQGLSFYLRLVAAFAALTYVIPYRNLAAKTAAFIMASTYLWDVLQFLLVDDKWLPYAVSFNVLVFVPWFVFAMWRGRRDVRSEPYEKGHVYRVTHKPDCFFDFFMSILQAKPIAGSGVLTDGYLYIYQQGELRKYDFARIKQKRLILIKTTFKDSNRLTAYLDRKIGSAWTLGDNCWSLWRHIRKDDLGSPC